ncbi:MAG TPA: DUF6519 domain-containing protein [Longimicrobium sp.]|nr:DUF6519 domain-containing protein [Longimicrobium sp.]
MKGDFSRQTFDPTRHHAGVRMQQGRVQLDADWNEQADIAQHRDEAAVRDTVGRCGGPLHHAAFGLTPATNLGAGARSELAGRFPGWTAGPGDFVLSAGRYWVNGVLVENEETVPYTRQPDLPGLPALGDGSWLLYLDVWERHLTALEDPRLREVALGGPDTATRTRTTWQVRALEVDAAATCAAEVADYDEATAETTGRMRARARRESTVADPCVLPAAAGYTGLENQLYRVEIHDGGVAQPFPGLSGWAVDTFDAPNRTMVLASTPGGLGVGDAVELYLPDSDDPTAGTVAWVEEVAGKSVTLNGAFTAPDLNASPRLRKVGATFKWSRDNGIAVSRVLSVNQELVVVETLGPDDVLGFHAGEWVELFDDAHELEARPGQFLQVKARNDATRTLVLNAPAALGGGDGIDMARNPRVRRWDGVGAVRGDSDYPAEAYTALEDGVEVRFDAGTYATGEWWLIPARTATAEAQSGGVEWPLDADEVPLARRPEGIQHHYCRLAVATLAGGAVTALEDCRCFFAPLTRVNALSYVSGAGQEAMPDPVATGEKVPLGQPLVVGVPNGHCEPGEETVRFTVRDGAGDLSANGTAWGGQTTLDLPIGADGLARCWWRLSGDHDAADPATLQQRVEARLLQDGVPVQLPIFFNASLSVAHQVSYDPGACGGMAGRNTVQKAIDRLAGFVRIHAAGGQAQEVMPGESLDRTLSVRLASDCGPVQAAAAVRFEVTKGTAAGRVDGSVTVVVDTDADGLAEVTWTLDPGEHFQEVRATALPAAGVLAEPETVFFTATLSTADRVAYDPGACATLSGDTTVQAAIDRLAGLLRMSAAGPTSRVLLPGEAWTGLAVRVAGDCGAFDSAQPLVRFEAGAGNGTFSNGQAAMEVPTGAQGIATVDWTPDPAAPRQSVRASFVAAPERRTGAPAEVVFDAWLADAPNVAYTPGEGCGELAAAGADTVKKAIDYLCSHVGVCCEVTLAPNDPDLAGKIAAYAQFTDDLDICFRPGKYVLTEPVVITGKRSVRVSGRGVGTHVVCPAESVFIFEDCHTVAVRDLEVTAGAETPPAGEHLNGALTFRVCRDVSVEGCRLTCAPGLRRSASCVSVSFGELIAFGTPPSRVTIRGCEARVGHRQVGFVLLNSDRAVVEDNVLRLDGIAPQPVIDLVTADPVFMELLDEFLKTPDGFLTTQFPLSEQERIWSMQPEVGLGYRPRGIVTKDTPGIIGTVEAVASEAILVAGLNAGEIRVRGNTITGFRRGVHVGFSQRGRGGPTMAAVVTVAENNILLKQPFRRSGPGHGVYVGDSLSLRITGNRISSWTLLNDYAADGVRVHGHVGGQMLVNENHVVDCYVGMHIHPLNWKHHRGMWRVAHNVVQGSELAFDIRNEAQGLVLLDGNFPSGQVA